MGDRRASGQSAKGDKIMGWLTAGAILAATAISAGASIYSANQASEASDEASKAQKEAADKIAKAQEEAAAKAKEAQEAATAAKPATAKVSTTSGTNIERSRLRGIQATLMASRSAQNENAGGKSTLGE